ncbi:MAG TPA: hypothetical protein VFX16_21090 [Pseudonocardiaceae bacterium]|nr:hypothetical protein [Pseudonocardiaceae bacterium]
MVGQNTGAGYAEVDAAPALWINRHPSVAHFQSLFLAFEHLPVHLQEVARPFTLAALAMLVHCQDGPELAAGLRKLLKAKDCAVRQAVIDQQAVT